MSALINLAGSDLSQHSSLDDVGQVLATLERLIAQKTQNGDLARSEEARRHLVGLRETFQLETPSESQICSPETSQSSNAMVESTPQSSEQRDPVDSIDQFIKEYQDMQGVAPPGLNILDSVSFEVDFGFNQQLVPSTERQSFDFPLEPSVRAQQSWGLADLSLSMQHFPTLGFARLQTLPPAPEVLQPRRQSHVGVNYGSGTIDTLLGSSFETQEDDFLAFQNFHTATTTRKRAEQTDAELNTYHIEPEGNFEGDAIMVQLVNDNQIINPTSIFANGRSTRKDPTGT